MGVGSTFGNGGNAFSSGGTTVGGAAAVGTGSGS